MEKHGMQTQQGLAVSRLWAGPPGPRRGRAPQLTLQQIVTAAVEIARTHGLTAVTISRVADRAGCAKMAIYRHVTNQADLIAAMIDHAVGPAPQLGGTWRERFAVLWDSLLAVYSKDPWLLELPAETNALTPHNLAWIDAALGVLEVCSVPEHERLEVLLLITENARFAARRRRPEGSPTNDLDVLMSSAADASHRLSAERFPHLVALSKSHRDASQRLQERGVLVREHVMRSIAVLEKGVERS